jgi:hypothetical protein
MDKGQHASKGRNLCLAHQQFAISPAGGVYFQELDYMA